MIPHLKLMGYVIFDAKSESYIKITSSIEGSLTKLDGVECIDVINMTKSFSGATIFEDLDSATQVIENKLQPIVDDSLTKGTLATSATPSFKVLDVSVTFLREEEPV